MKLDDSDFALFQLPEQFDLDSSLLHLRWKELQAKVHPDKFVAEGPAAQRIAMQWSVRLNEAYQRLKDPLKRASLLCELAGAAINAENNTAMPSHFLMQQMQWREELEEAVNSPQLERLLEQVITQKNQRFQLVQQYLDQDKNFTAASQEVRAIMFIQKLIDEVKNTMYALEDQ
jgi:molecular chaperone HscB